MNTIPKRVQERFREQVPKYQQILRDAMDSDTNEAETVAIIEGMLADIFGFTKFKEIRSEYAIKGKSCDLAVQIDSEVRYLVEVKAIGLNLKRHAIQPIIYGAIDGTDYVVLTNGIIWELYYVTRVPRTDGEQIFAFNFLELVPQKEEHQETLYTLSKEGSSRTVMEGHRKRAESINRYTIGALLLTEQVSNIIRKGIKGMSPDLRVESEEIVSILEHEVIKREILEDEKGVKAAARVKKWISHQKSLYPSKKTKQEAQPEDHASLPQSSTSNNAGSAVSPPDAKLLEAKQPGDRAAQ